MSDSGAAVGGPPRRHLPWRAQMVLLLVIVLVAALSIALGGALAIVRTSVEQEAQQRALSIAQAVAADPRYAQWVQSSPPSASGPVQAAAEQVRARTGAMHVVVANAAGIRYSHPDPASIGEHVSTDMSAALAGRDEVAIEQGTLGWSARGKTPLRDASGRIVGAVSAGVPLAVVYAGQRRLSAFLAGVAVVALAGGLLALAFFWRRLRRTTHGLEPEEMADLLREHAAVLAGALDGVVAVDAAGVVRICNEAARRYLGIAAQPSGRPVAQAGLPAPIVDMLTAAQVAPARPAGRLVVAKGRVFDVRALPVERDGHDLGRVVVLRDRTDLDDLGRELEATRALTDALRAQTHEHSNRLHALAGMLHLNHVTEAQTYLDDLAGTLAWDGDVDDPYLAGLLAAKTAAAAERGVTLRIDEDTWVPGRVQRPLDCVSVVGNLLDNAIRAAADGQRRPAWVEVTLLVAGRGGSDLLVHVVDSGDGVRPGSEEAIFGDGWTTKVGEETGPGGRGAHGVGLALARVTARHHGGDVRLVAASGPVAGAAAGAAAREGKPESKGEDRASRGRIGVATNGARGHGAAFEALLVGMLDGARDRREQESREVRP